MAVRSFLQWLVRLSWQSPAERQCTLTWDTLADFQSAPHGSASLCLRSRSTTSVKEDYCSHSRRQLMAVLPSRPRVVALWARHSGYVCDNHRLAGDHFWRVLANTTGYPTWLLATHEHRPHCRP